MKIDEAIEIVEELGNNNSLWDSEVEAIKKVLEEIKLYQAHNKRFWDNVIKNK